IGGTGGFTKVGASTLAVRGTNANTYTGTTIVIAGTLLLAKTVANASIHGPIIIGDGSRPPNSAILQLTNTTQLGTGSAMTINADGLFDANGVGESFDSLAGSGNVHLGGASQVTFGSDGSSTEFSGVISESGNIEKLGGGTMILSG